MKKIKLIVAALLITALSTYAQTNDSLKLMDASVDSLLNLPVPDLSSVINNYEGATRFCETAHRYLELAFKHGRVKFKDHDKTTGYAPIQLNEAGWTYRDLNTYFCNGVLDSILPTDMERYRPNGYAQCTWTNEERCIAAEAACGISLHNWYFDIKGNQGKHLAAFTYYGKLTQSLCGHDPYFGDLQISGGTLRGASFATILKYLEDPNAFEYNQQVKAIEKEKADRLKNPTDEDKFGAYKERIEAIDKKYLPDSAIHMWQRCKINGYAIRCKTEIADLYYQAGKYEKAITALKAGLVIWTNGAPDENSMLVRNNLCAYISDCCYKLGDIANGKKYYLMSQ